MADAVDDQGAAVHRSSLVGTERLRLASTMLGLDDDSFAQELQRRFGDSLGRLSLWGGRRWSYPVSLLHAERTIDSRLELVGDAAHGLHPIAGQRLTRGLPAVAAMAATLANG